MRLFFVLATLVGVFLVGGKYVGAGIASASEHLCMVAVKNGRPTPADIGQVHRMVSSVDVIPHLSQPYIQPLNRGGRWTVDQEGTFRPFQGIFPTRGLESDRQWIVDGSGRVVGANNTDLFVIDPPDDAFRHLLSLDDVDAGHMWQLEYEAHSGVVYLSTSRDLYELRGDALVRSPYASEASELGLGLVFPPHYLPSLDAHIFETRSRKFALRYREGAWRIVHTLRCEDGCRNYLPEIVDLKSENLVVVKTAKELFAIDVSNPQDPHVTEIYWDRGNIGSMRLSSETGAFLIHDDEVFLRLSADPRFPSVSRDDSWLLRVTRDGVRPVSGEKIVPDMPSAGTRSIYVPGFLDLPGRGQALVLAKEGLALFDGDAVRLIPDSGPNQLGPWPRPIILRSVDRVVIVSTKGIYELTKENRLVRLETPFEATGYPPPKFVDAPHIGVAIILSKDGAYTLNQQGEFQHVPGGDAVELGWLTRGLAVLPKSGDVLIQGKNALHLLRTAPCTR